MRDAVTLLRIYVEKTRNDSE